MKSKLIMSENGSFKVKQADQISYLYFPLTNYHSLKSAITPSLNGDSKIDQNQFLLLPNSSEDLHNSFMNRNVFFKVNDDFVWSVTGNTPYQMLHKDEVDVEGDFLVHKVIRSNSVFTCEIESLVPFKDAYQESHKVTLKNISPKRISIKPVVGVPMFCRSADNLRDHRHVSALLNSVDIVQNGMVNTPTFSFDERGHILNDKHYGIFVTNNHKTDVSKYWPVLEEFIGEGGNLLDPLVVKEDTVSSYQVGDTISGYEMTGGFEYETVSLQPGESYTIVLTMVIDDNKDRLFETVSDLSVRTFDAERKQTLRVWENELSTLQFSYGDASYNGWLRWVTLQPILRRVYGCSFLPHHDYGRGGRGWRDLWQDCLALILMDPKEVRHILLNNFLGVRIDGSNATIIGEQLGEFLADRNNIPRVWMDHGSWPLLTTKLYVDKSGDYQFLLEDQLYFNDKFSHYTKQVNEQYSSDRNILYTDQNDIYKGSILEHLIIQNVVPFFNVGEHNNLRLEDADWNDGLDMAHGHGESVAFTSFYGGNLVSLANILRSLEKKGVKEVSLLHELCILFSCEDIHSISCKNETLKAYFDAVKDTVSGKKKTYLVHTLATQLEKLGNYLLEQVRQNEFLEGENGAWFNGYYDNDKQPLDNVEKEHMTLTGQVFAIMSGSATDDQIKQIITSADKYLYSKAVGGYRLNTDFKEVKTNMGRLFGFAYGHKENGAMFSHMAVMYANALYKRGYAKEGYKVIQSIYQHCSNIDKSKIYPGIPEYIDPKGRGMYHYLTGSASWYILTEVTEVFGVKGDFGEVVLEPKLLKQQFSDAGEASIKTLINNQVTEIVYSNPDHLDYGDYQVVSVEVDGVHTPYKHTKYGVKVSIQNASKIVVQLSKK